jgi:hypothetical protein
MSFAYKDVQEIKELALKSYNKLPSRVRIPGHDKELSVEEARWLAFLDAATTFFNMKGMLKEEHVNTNPLHLVKQSSETVFDE